MVATLARPCQGAKVSNYTNDISTHLLDGHRLAAMRKIGKAATPCTRALPDWHLPEQHVDGDDYRCLVLQRLALCDVCPVLAECQAVIDPVPGQVSGGVWTRAQGMVKIDPARSADAYREVGARMGLNVDLVDRLLARHGVAIEEAAA